MKAIHDEARGTLLEEPRFEDALRALTAYHDSEGVLSVYLDIDPATAGREGYEAVLLDLWKPLHARATDPWLRGRLEYEIDGVTGGVRSWQQAPARAVAMFFSGPGGLRTILPLRFSVRSLARFEPRPVLGPLIAALDEHRRYCVVMFDKAEARLITVVLDAVEEEVRLNADVIGRSAVGGWGGYLQGRYARHREHHLAEHARRTVEHLWAIDKSRPLHGLILSGPDEALAVLRRMLPSALARSVAATLSIEMFASTDDVLRKVASVEETAREQEDARIVEQVITEAEKGGAATLGWDETLQALAEGRVHMVVLPANATRPGVECPQDHFLATGAADACPLCGEQLFQTEDVVESAIRAAMHTDALVHFLAPRASRLIELRGAAAILRF
jgi:peptide subunit release factor 1 (eRF1)